MTKGGEVVFDGWLTANTPLDSFSALADGFEMEILAVDL